MRSAFRRVGVRVLRGEKFWVLASAVLGLLAGPLGLGGCKNESVPGPDFQRDYYPVRVGNYRVYAVYDTAWGLNGRSTSQYQLRETVVDSFADASGQRAYRVERARRADAAQPWQTDSVLVLLPTARTVQLVQNNRRTVELVFPPRVDRGWNVNAFNQLDTITNLTRRYAAVGGPYALATGPGAPPTTYPETATVENMGTAAQNDATGLIAYTQVFARGVGPVLRRRRNFVFCFAEPTCTGNPADVYRGSSRREVLLDYGPK